MIENGKMSNNEFKIFTQRIVGINLPLIWIYENEISINCQDVIGIKKIENELKIEIEKFLPEKYWHENHEFTISSFKGGKFRKPLAYAVNSKFSISNNESRTLIKLESSFLGMFLLVFFLPITFIAFMKFATGMSYFDFGLCALALIVVYISNFMFSSRHLNKIAKNAIINSIKTQNA